MWVGMVLLGATLMARSQTSQNAAGQPHNCKPSKATNVTSSCPQLTDSGALSATSFCVDEGDPMPPWPVLVRLPQATTGEVVTTITTIATDCSTTVDSKTNTVTYKFSALKHRNGNGPPDGNSSPGSYWSEYYVTVTSSDPTNCPPNPADIDYGIVTWNVVSTNETKITVAPQKTFGAVIKAMSLATEAVKVIGCTGTNFSVSGTIEISWKDVCCNSTNGPYRKSSVKGKVNIGLPTLKCPIPGLSVALPSALAEYGKLGVFFNYSGSAEFSGVLGVAQPCETAPICLNGGIKQSLGVSVDGKIELPAGWLQCGIDATGGFKISANMDYKGPDSNGECSLGGNLGRGVLEYSVAVKALGFSCTLLSDSIEMWPGVKVGPKTVECMCFDFTSGQSE